MNRFLILIFGLFLVWMPPAGQAGSASTNEPSLFGLTNLWTIRLTMTASDWKVLGSRGGPQRMNNNGGGDGVFEGIIRNVFQGNNQPNQNQRRVQGGGDDDSKHAWGHCTLEAGGQKWTNVSMRFKGVSSLVRSPNGYKRPFKFDFDRDSKDRRFMGVEELYFNNNVNDATQMREALAYELFRRAGLPAPRTAFARVYLTIPGRMENRLLGLYTLVEVVEGDFLKRAFGSKKGLLLKPESMQGLEYMGDNWNSYVDRYHPKHDPTPEEAKRFMEFVKLIRQASPDQFSARLGDYLETEQFAKFVALNAILANVDSFLGNGHNYFLYNNPTSHRATFIPWDLNESFGMHPVSGASGDQMMSSVLRPNADPNLLVERFIKDPVFGPMYRAQCAALLTNIFVPSKLAKDIDRIAAVTKPVVFEESKRAKADFERTVLGTLGPDDGDTSQPRFDQEYARDGFHPWGFPSGVQIDNMPLKEWISGRAVNVRDQLEGRVRGNRPRPRL
ncbi:MAG TPA: CotH kinase family protein [Candidatus Limnocylindria bacterium]|nr:CotH kinase family protein [Candidatus Limnocylindria bacterium]